MVSCPQCGEPLDNSRCEQCGAAVDWASLNGPATSSPAVPKTDFTENVACLLCYAGFFFTGVAFLALAPYNRNRNIRFHAFQSIFYSAAWFIAGVALSFITGLFPSLAVVGNPLWLALLLLWAYVMWKAYRNQRVVLPLIGTIAEKQA